MEIRFNSIHGPFALTWLVAILLVNSTLSHAQDVGANGVETNMVANGDGANDSAKAVDFTYDPVVATIEEATSNSPRDLLRASLTLLDLGRHDLANHYLKQLAGQRPVAEEMVALHRQFGSAALIRLTINSQLDPAVRQLASDILTAAAQQATNSQRLDRLTKESLAEDLNTRVAAIAELLRGGSASVAPLLRALQANHATAQQQRLLDILTRLGEAAESPLIATLETANQSIRGWAIRALERMDSQLAVDYLFGPALIGNDTNSVLATEAILALTGNHIGNTEAGRRLYGKVLDLLHGTAHFPVGYPNRSLRWRWNDDRADFDQQLQRQDIVDALLAARLSRDLHQLVPHNAVYRQFYLLSHLQANKLAHGLSKPIPQGEKTIFALTAGEPPAALDDLLAQALRADLIPAAIGVCEVLANHGNSSFLAASDHRRSPLAQALIHSNRRLQIAAAHAILSMHPTHLFPGACDVTDLLDVLLRSTGQRRVLIVHPNELQAADLAGWCREMGFVAETAQTGQRGLAQAFSRADYEIVLISDAVFSPRWTELVQLFRRDPRTGDLPIGLLVRNEPMTRAMRVERENGLLIAYPFPSEPARLSSLLSHLSQLRGSEPITSVERLAHTRWALDWLDHVTAMPKLPAYLEVTKLLPALVTSIQHPPFTTTATKVLGRLGTAPAQTALVEMIDNNTASLASRRSATEAFELAVERRGLQLTNDQILQQYRLYTGTPETEIEVLRMMNTVLQSIEHSAKQAKEPDIQQDGPQA